MRGERIEGDREGETVRVEERGRDSERRQKRGRYTEREERVLRETRRERDSRGDRKDGGRQ